MPAPIFLRQEYSELRSQDGRPFGSSVEHTACLVNKYDQITAVPGLNVNGELTLGKNIADNGGIRLAMMALMARMATRLMRSG